VIYTDKEHVQDLGARGPASLPPEGSLFSARVRRYVAEATVDHSLPSADAFEAHAQKVMADINSP